MRSKIGVFVIPKFQIDSAAGGAENICRLVVLSLEKKYDVVVLHGEANLNDRIGVIKNHTEYIQSINAFYLDDYTRHNGEIAPNFCTEAEKIISECKILLSFERVIVNLNINQICILGGISYKHCVDIAKSNIWNKLIVPSMFLKDKCRELSNRCEDIHVISNGIQCDCFFPTVSEEQFTTLLPYRADWGKGYRESIDFIAMLNGLGNWGEYRLIVTRQENNDFAEVDFYESLNHYAMKKNVIIEYLPWQNEDGMNSLYNKCDFVLSLGCLEEGFGLTTIEAIAAGRYIISRRKGATVSILPENSGIIFANENMSVSEVSRIMEEYSKALEQNEVMNGINYINNNYDISAMQKRYDEYVSRILSELN